MLTGNTLKGMVWDTHSDYTGEQTYSFVFNGSLHSFSGEQSYPFISNNYSNIECVNFRKGFKVIGIQTIKELNSSILALYNETTTEKLLLKVDYQKKSLGKGDSYNKLNSGCIELIQNNELINECNYTEILYTQCFNWSHLNPLHFEYKITDNTLNLYFVNGLDQDRFVYFNLSNFSLHDDFKMKINSDECNQIKLDSLDCDKTLWFPLLDSITIDLEKISGGTKKAGKYNYLFAYSTNKEIPLTPFYGLGQGISLFSIGKDTTEYGVKVDIKNITTDSRYRFYTLVVIEHVNGITSYKIKGTYPVSQKTIYDWNNDGSSIGLPTLMSQYPYYKFSESITESNNILFKASVQEFEKFNLQPVINNVEVQWVTTVLKEGDYKDDNSFVSFLRDENYLLGIEIIIDNLEKGPTFPLIPRSASLSELALTPNPLNLLEHIPTWKAYNTAEKIYTNIESLGDLYTKVKSNIPVEYERGNFGYFESTERYPNVKEVWGSLCNEPIRLFRFPDHKSTSHFSNTTDESNLNYIHPLGVKITTSMDTVFDNAVSQGLITQEQRDRIKGWKLVKANRSGNNSIIAKGLLYDMWEYNRTDKDENFSKWGVDYCSNQSDKYYFPNYPFNDLRDDPYLTEENNWYLDKSSKEIQNYNPEKLKFKNTGKYTFHSPETHFTNPDLRGNLKIENIFKGNAVGFFNQSEDQALQRLLNWKHFNFATSFGKFIAKMQPNPTKDEVQALATNIGDKAGGVVKSIGSAFGPIGALAGGVIGAFGGLIGGLVGEALYNDSIVAKYIDSAFSATITFSETEKIIQIIESIIKPQQYHYQYQAVGNYNSYENVNNNLRFREIKDLEYLSNGRYVINNNKINNFNRESSVYINLGDTNLLSPPTVGLDNSKFLLSNDTEFNSIVDVQNLDLTCYKWEVFDDEDFINKRQDLQSIWGFECQNMSNIPEDKLPVYFLENRTDLSHEGTIYFFDQNYNHADYSYSFGGEFDNFINAVYLAVARMTPDGELILKIEAIRLYIFYAINGNNESGVIYNAPQELLNRCYSKWEVLRHPTAYDTPTGVMFHNRLLTDSNDSDESYKDNMSLRIRKQEEGSCSTYSKPIFKYIGSPCQCLIERHSNIASYYGSIKQTIPNQYGTIYDINWINTNSGVNRTNDLIFGGDTYIGRFSLKRKHSFFNLTLFNNPEDTEINYSLLGNAANAIHYFDKNPLKKRLDEVTIGMKFPLNLTLFKSTNFSNTLINLFNKTLFNIDNQLNIPKYKLDCGDDVLKESYLTKFEVNSVNGLMYLYSYGIVSYIAESGINLDLRDKGNTLAEDFYPNQSDLSTWLQEKNVSPSIDNFYIYDKSFSEQPSEEFHYMYDLNYKGENDKIIHENRVLYSGQGDEIDNDDYSDPFLVNRALDYYDFTKKHGKIISIDGIEGDKVLVRQEHASSVYGSYITLNSNQDTVLISSGNIFNNKPVEFSTPDLGYFGSQHKALLNTPYGHFSVDAFRGQVFLLGNGGQQLDEISNKGMYSFFKEYLPFKINRYISNVSIDNNLNGIGISMVYDNRFQVVHLTKLDYIPLNTNITFNESLNKFFLGDVEVKLTDENYFTNASFTISYSMQNQMWYSFQPFTPLYYLSHVDYFETGIEKSLWRHNITNKNYQRFYGKLYPFIVETNTKVDSVYHTVKNVFYQLDVIKYFDDYNYVFNKELSFNKASVSTDKQSSGILNLKNVRNNLFLQSKLPKFNIDSTDVFLSIKEDFHSFNQFKNIVRHDNIPLFKNKLGSYFKELNQDALDTYQKRMIINYLIGNQIKVRLIQDEDDSHQYIFKGSYINDFIKNRI